MVVLHTGCKPIHQRFASGVERTGAGSCCRPSRPVRGMAGRAWTRRRWRLGPAVIARSGVLRGLQAVDRRIRVTGNLLMVSETSPCQRIAEPDLVSRHPPS